MNNFIIFIFTIWLCNATVAINGEPICPQKDGEFPVYIPHSECTKFYECSNGTPYLFVCPADLHFNPKLNVCDYPWRAGCLAPVCPEIDGVYPVYIPHSDCTKFYECSNGVPYLFDCPANLHFNPVLNVCDYPDNAGCATARSKTILVGE